MQAREMVPADTFRVTYSIGQTAPNLSDLNIRKAIRDIALAISRRTEAKIPTLVTITHYSSPDGINRINRYVGEERAMELRSIIAKEADYHIDSMVIADGGAGWGEVRRLIAASTLPDKSSMVAIIDGSSSAEECMTRMRALKGGKIYEDVRKRVFPVVKATICVIVSDPPEPVAEEPELTFEQQDSLLHLSDSALRLIYNIGQITPDMTRNVNRRTYAAILDCIASQRAKDAPLCVVITHFSAPDGINNINRYVGETRAAKLQTDLCGEAHLTPGNFAIVNGGSGWEQVKQLVAASSRRNKAQIINIIDSTDISGRLAALKSHDRGRTYKWLVDYIFPSLRSILAVTVTDRRPQLLAEDKPVEIDPGISDFKSRIVLKTNLLYYAVLAPNIELEYMISPKWSVNIDYTMAWWKKKSNDKTYQVAAVSPEARWWFHSNAPFRGHYVGVFPGYTWFDLENGTGHRGYGIFAGISYGYMWRLSATLSMEAGIGVGYMSLKYEDYRSQDGHNVFSKSKTASYIGPLKAKLTLVWRPWVKKSHNKRAIGK